LHFEHLYGPLQILQLASEHGKQDPLEKYYPCGHCSHIPVVGFKTYDVLQELQTLPSELQE